MKNGNHVRHSLYLLETDDREQTTIDFSEVGIDIRVGDRAITIYLDNEEIKEFIRLLKVYAKD